MLARHLTEEAPPLVITGTPLASGLEAIVKKALRKRPGNRYASVEALLGDLSRLERRESLAARLPLEDADVYVPSEPFAKQATVFLHRRLGKDPPP